MRPLFLLAVWLVCAAIFAPMLRAAEVHVQKTTDGWRLLRDGKPYFVQGACVWGDDSRLDALAKAGANSARNYWEGDAQSTLDRATNGGLSVTLGLQIDLPRHGADFNDPKIVDAQKARVRASVEKWKNHPALLAWGLGNEVELLCDDAGRTRVFQVLNDLARMVKELDPHHPCVVVLAGIDEPKTRKIAQFCPDVDIIGINAYGSLPALPGHLDEWGFERPYFVTEFGPVGYWEAPHTAWNAPLEATSSEKAAQFERAFSDCIAKDTRRCLGSYAFFWDNKQEATATWFGLFLKSGERLQAQDVLSKQWTGRAVANPCPNIEPIELASDHFATGAVLTARVQVTSARPLKLEWALFHESSDRKNGGDAENAPEQVAVKVTDTGVGKMQLALPREPGAYRLFVVARDDKGNAATANCPIFVGP